MTSCCDRGTLSGLLKGSPMAERQSTSIRLSESEKKKLNTIARQRGLETGGEAIRMLIREEADRLAVKKKKG